MKPMLDKSPQKPDSPVKSRTPGNPNNGMHRPVLAYTDPILTLITCRYITSTTNVLPSQL